MFHVTSRPIVISYSDFFNGSMLVTKSLSGEEGLLKIKYADETENLRHLGTTKGTVRVRCQT